MHIIKGRNTLDRQEGCVHEVMVLVDSDGSRDKVALIIVTEYAFWSLTEFRSVVSHSATQITHSTEYAPSSGSLPRCCQESTCSTTSTSLVAGCSAERAISPRRASC